MRTPVAPGLEPLLTELESEVSRECEALLESARAEAAAIDTASRARLEARRADAIRSFEDEAARREARILAQARREARSNLLRARVSAVARVLAEVGRLLPATLSASALSDEEVGSWVSGVLSYVEGEPCLVRCSPALVERVRCHLIDTPSVRLEAADGMGTGIQARTLDGRVVVDDTLETRLARMSPELAIEILAALEA